jgi:hypothetical protein
MYLLSRTEVYMFGFSLDFLSIFSLIHLGRIESESYRASLESWAQVSNQAGRLLEAMSSR